MLASAARVHLTHASAARVLSKDMAIVLKLLTFAVPKDNNAFSDWRMLQVSKYKPNYRLRARKNSDC